MAGSGWTRAAVRLLRQPAGVRRLAVVAALQLIRASIELRLLPSRRTVALLGVVQGGALDASVSATELRAAMDAGLIVARVARRLPWRPTCLRQALAVRRMLHARGIPSSIHLGVTGPSAPAAHAWVTVQGQAVVGAEGMERFVPLAAFR